MTNELDKSRVLNLNIYNKFRDKNIFIIFFFSQSV